MYMLCRFCFAIVVLDSDEYACPGYTTVSSSQILQRVVEAVVHRLRFDPGKSTRPHEFTNSVSPEMRLPSTRKHCDPGVCPGVWRNFTSRSPDLDYVAGFDLDDDPSRSSPATFLAPSASCLLT